jgi:hypothetical protein
MERKKPIPRSQRNEFNRGTKLSRNTDDVKNLSVGIMDMDSAIMYYFNEVIKPSVEINDEKVKVPCIYASPERWTQVSKQGFLRDKKRQIITPLIVFKRTGMERNDDIPVDKLDANDPKLFYTFQKKYSQQNRFDKFSVQKNLEPNREYYNVAMPDYMTLTYEFIVWTSYIEQMNRIVEKINYSDGAYWGEPGKMRFKTRIESFSDSSQVDGERLIKTTFGVTLNGYILPETFNNYTTTQKYLTPKRLVIRENVDTNLEELAIEDKIGFEGGELTKDIFSVSLSNPFTLEQGLGVSISNNGVGFDGSSALTQQISIGQDVSTDANVQFNTMTTNQLNIGTGTTKFTDGGISGSVALTGSFVVSQSATILGDLIVTGSLVSDLLITQVTTRSVDFSSGSNEFGDTIDDKHEFTGSVDISGSFILNGYSVNEISNDSTFIDESPTTLVTEQAIANFNVATLTTDETTYLRKQFYKTSSDIVSTNTASFNATTASAPSGVTDTSINDFVFFINGQYMEHDALAIRQTGSAFHLEVNTTSIGYDLESDDEILAIGKFDS